MRTLHGVLRATALMFTAYLVGCTNSGIGICDTTYHDPLITIADARDAETGAALPDIAIRNVFIDGFLAQPDFLVGAPVPVHGVGVDGNDLLCTLACGFGSTEGSYTLTAHRPSYRDTTIRFDAHYSHASGNCPRTVSGGLTLHLTMSHE